MHDKCAKEEGEGDSKMGSWEQCDAVMEYLRDLNLLSITLRIILSVLIGGILGIERGTKNRPAGLRTYILVCLGSALVMMTNQYVCTAYQTGDPVRLGAQVVSGIGFLGAGTILVTRQNQVRGLTTAAGLWAVACIGLALGAGFYTGALVVFAAIWISLRMLRIVHTHLNPALKSITLHVEFAKISDMSQFIAFAKNEHCIIDHLEMTRPKKTSESTAVSAIIALSFAEELTYSQIVETYGGLEGVTYIDYAYN